MNKNAYFSESSQSHIEQLIVDIVEAGHAREFVKYVRKMRPNDTIQLDAVSLDSITIASKGAGLRKYYWDEIDRVIGTWVEDTLLPLAVNYDTRKPSLTNRIDAHLGEPKATNGASAREHELTVALTYAHGRAMSALDQHDATPNTLKLALGDIERALEKALKK